MNRISFLFYFVIQLEKGNHLAIIIIFQGLYTWLLSDIFVLRHFFYCRWNRLTGWFPPSFFNLCPKPHSVTFMRFFFWESPCFYLKYLDNISVLVIFYKFYIWKPNSLLLVSPFSAWHIFFTLLSDSSTFGYPTSFKNNCQQQECTGGTL